MASRNNAAPATATATATGAQHQAETPAINDRKTQILNRIGIFFCDFITASLVAIILFCFFSIILFFITRPHQLQFTVVSAAVTPLNATGSDLGASWSFSILVHNPNSHLRVYYNRLEVSVFYGEDFLLSQTRLEPMYQGQHNTTLLEVRLVSNYSNVGDDVVRGVLNDLRHEDEVVSFRVRILSTARFRRGRWLSRTHLVEADCNDMAFKFSSSRGYGAMMVPRKKCKRER